MRISRLRLLLILGVLVGSLAAVQAASAALLPLELSPPSISGSAEQGQTITCSSGSWLNSPSSYSYSWQRDATTSIGGTSNSYTLTAADVNHLITCTVVAHNGAGASLPAISAPVVPVALPVASVPVETAAPAISGTAQQGQAVDCSQGSWANNPTSYSYSWQRDATAISGATGSTYMLTSADVNQAITCTVVAHNGSGDSAPAVSAPVVPLALPAPPIETGPPVISGSAEQGQTVSCSTGAWTNGPTSYSYSWQRSASSIAGQTSSTYTLTSADVNQAITCTVVAHNGSGDSAPATSAPITPVAVPVALVPVEAAPPTISGSPEQGQTVNCSTGGWANNPTSYSYSWERDASAISGATGPSYTLSSADVNRAITCTVVAHNGAGDSVPAISAPIVPVALPTPPVETAPPSISGSPEQGQTVTCSTGSWLNGPTSYSYTWQRDGSNIGGAAGSSYQLTKTDVTQAITCTVIAHNAAGDSAPAISVPIVPVAVPTSAVPVETAPPVISGTPQAGQTVSCLAGSWTNSPTSFTYTWQRAAVAIGGATSPSYTLTSTDVGEPITCTVVAINAAGLSVPGISLPILPVEGSNSTPAPVNTTTVVTTATAAPTPSPAPPPAPTPAKPVATPAKLKAPTVTSLSVSPGKLTILVKGKRRSTKGTTFHYGLDQAAGVLLEVQQAKTGRASGSRCLAVTRSNSRARRCTRWVTVRVLAVRNGHKGGNTFKYLGRIGKGSQLLVVGKYRVYAAAENRAGWSKLRSASFSAVRKLVKSKPAKKQQR
jgi:hypothetical protein